MLSFLRASLEKGRWILSALEKKTNPKMSERHEQAELKFSQWFYCVIQKASLDTAFPVSPVSWDYVLCLGRGGNPMHTFSVSLLHQPLLLGRSVRLPEFTVARAGNSYGSFVWDRVNEIRSCGSERDRDEFVGHPDYFPLKSGKKQVERQIASLRFPPGASWWAICSDCYPSFWILIRQ